MADIAFRVDHLEEDVRAVKEQAGENAGRLDLHSKGFDRLIKWALEGNGDSAETRLKNVEIEAAAMKTCIEKAVAPEHIAHIAKETAAAVIKNAQGKDRTWVAKTKAIASVLAPIGVIIGGVAALIAMFAR